MSSPALKQIWNTLGVGKRNCFFTSRILRLRAYQSRSSVSGCLCFHRNASQSAHTLPLSTFICRYVRSYSEKNIRLLSTSAISVSGSSANDITSVKGGIQVSMEGSSLHLPFIWLRDHCHCDLCYNHKTNQKNIENFNFHLNVEPLKIDYNGTQMTLTWPDNHTTIYKTSWLLSKAYHSEYKSNAACHLWNCKDITSSPPPRIRYDDHMNSVTALTRSIFNLLKFGFTIVTQVPPTEEDTRQVVEKISTVKKTLFGEMWSFTSDEARGDTAYTNIALGAHTDTTYCIAPAGIQVFHCLEHAGDGGETLLLDGFNAAKQLQEKDPEAFDILAKTVVPHQYLESGFNIHSLGSVLTVHPTSGEMVNIRFNPYDRAPLNTIPPEKLPAFYQAYQALTKEIKKEENEFWIKLEPGMVLFLDNWRVLHGRGAFTGKRVITGCYLSRDEWLSKARVLQVL